MQYLVYYNESLRGNALLTAGEVARLKLKGYVLVPAEDV